MVDSIGSDISMEKILCEGILDFAHRGLLLISMYPKSTGENDISSPLYKRVPAILSLFHLLIGILLSRFYKNKIIQVFFVHTSSYARYW